MFFLPKGVVLAENILTSKIDLPSALNKLRNSTFSGYAQVTIPSGIGFFLYVEGRMISVQFRRKSGNCLHNIEAIKNIIESLVLSRDGSFSVYGLSREIASVLLALFKCNNYLVEQEIQSYDFKGLIETIRSENMNACLKVYTDDQEGMILYHDGVPVGFFHDSALEIGMSQTEVQKIVRLAGAKMDVQTVTKNEKKSIQSDLNEIIDIAKMWSIANENVFSTAAAAPVTLPIVEPVIRISESCANKKIAELHSSLVDIAITYLGKLGQVLAEKELAKTGDPKKLLVPVNLEELLGTLEKGSKMLTSPVKIRQMQEAMRCEITYYSCTE